MTEPLVSIIVPAYNAAETLRDTLGSVAAQTFRDFELIAVDDGSVDATPAVLAGCARQWPWLKHVRQANAGVAAARNAAIAESRGRYVALLDADDIWKPDKLALQMAVFADKPEVAFVFADHVEVRDGVASPRSMFEQRAPARGWILPRLFMNSFIQTSTAVIRKDALLAVGGFNAAQRLNEDIDLWYRLAEVYPFDYVDKVLVERRLVSTSLMHTFPHECLARDFELIDYWVARRPDLFPEDSECVRRGRALTHARIGARHLFDRKFAAARRSYRTALAMGQRDPSTLVHALAAHVPPIAHAFWTLRALRQRLRGT